MDLKKSLPLILQKAVVWVSFKRLFLLFATALVVIASLAIFEGRAVITEVFESHRDVSTAPVEPTVKLSGALQERIAETVRRSPRIIGVAVQTVNLKVNEKRVIFQYSDSPALTQLFDQNEKARGVVNVVFDTDQLNNLQMVAVVNGEFICSKFTETQAFRLFPEMGKQVQSVCRLSIPPFYGNFGGFVTFFLDATLTTDLENEIRIDAVRTSNDVYRELLLTRRVNNPK